MDAAAMGESDGRRTEEGAGGSRKSRHNAARDLSTFSNLYAPPQPVEVPDRGEAALRGDPSASRRRSMHNAGYELRGIPLLRYWVNKASKRLRCRDPYKAAASSCIRIPLPMRCWAPGAPPGSQPPRTEQWLPVRSPPRCSWLSLFPQGRPDPAALAS
jgi:hypothetical protein